MLGGEVGVFVFEFFVAALFALGFFAFEALFTELVLFTCGMRSLACPVWIGSHWHLDAVNGAGWYAQFAAVATLRDDGVHEFGSADDGIYGAGLDAFGAADALVFDDVGDAQGLFNAVFWIERNDGAAGNVCELGDARCATWWTLVDGFVVKCDGVGVGCAAVKTALGALGLR